MAIKRNQIETTPVGISEGTTPAAQADKGVFYTKDVSGVTEGFYLDSNGSEVQITEAGAIKLPAIFGEANTASNVGAGFEVFKQKTGVDLEFKTILAGAGIIVSDGPDSMTISSNTAGVNTLFDLTDTTISGVADNQLLQYNSSSAKWENVTFPLTGISDVNIPSPNNGEVLTFNSSTGQWEANVAPGSGGGESNVGANVGTGIGLFRDKVSTTLNFRSLIAGTNITLVNNGDDITINSTGGSGGSGEVNTASNVGGGQGIFRQKTGVDLELKSLLSSGSISLNSTTDAITISSSAEANTASNVGTGTAIFKQKSGINLEFKSLVAGTNITLVNNGDDITINSTGGGGGSGETNTASNVGGGVDIFKQKTSVDLEFKTLVAGTNVTLTPGTDTITIASSGGGGSSVGTEYVVKLGAGTDIATMVANAPAGGIPAGWTVVDATDGSVDSALSGNADDVVFIHNEGGIHVGVSSTRELTFPSTQYKNEDTDSGLITSNAAGTQTRISQFISAMGQQANFTLLKFV
jgi:hypothetical protein